MPLLKIEAFAAAPTKSGVSLKQGESRGRTYFRLGLSAAAQMDLFDRALDPEKDCVALTVTNEPNLNHLMGIRATTADDPAGLPISGGPHGSVGLKVTAWRGNGGGSRPAASLTVINRQVKGGGISVKLPDWARPEPDLSSKARRA